MKRLVALGLGIIMAFSLCSCGNKGDEAGDKEAKYGITMEFTSDTDDADSDYSVAVDPAIADAAAVEEFASQAKEAVLNEDVDWIVQNAGYPFHLVGKDVAGAEELKAALSAEDSPIKAEAFKEKVKGLETTDLFANSQGVMLGDGELWFGQVDDALRIITINGV